MNERNPVCKIAHLVDVDEGCSAFCKYYTEPEEELINKGCFCAYNKVEDKHGRNK